MAHCGERHAVHVLNKDNLGYYLKEIPEDLYRVERDVYRPSAGGLVRRLNRRKRAASRIAIRLAYVRLRLLYEYGGLWLDSDCITMSDYAPVEEALQEHEIVGVSKRSHGENHITNNFIAASPKSPKLKRIIEEQNDLIGKRYLKWGEIGGTLLAKRLLGQEDVFLFDEKKVLPLPWEEANKFFLDEPLDVVERYRPMCCMLYNNIFPEHFKKKAPDEIYGDRTLVSRLFQKHAA